MKKPNTPTPSENLTIILDGKYDTLISIDIICHILQLRPIDLEFIIGNFKPYLHTEPNADSSQPGSLFIPSYILSEFLRRIPAQNLSENSRKILISARSHLLTLIDMIRWDALPQLYADRGILAQREREALEKIAKGAIQIHHKAMSLRQRNPQKTYTEKILSTASTEELKGILKKIANDLSTQEIQRFSKPGKQAAICAWLGREREGGCLTENYRQLFVTENAIDVYEEMPTAHRRRIYKEDSPDLG